MSVKKQGSVSHAFSTENGEIRELFLPRFRAAVLTPKNMIKKKKSLENSIDFYLDRSVLQRGKIGEGRYTVF